MKYLKKNLPIVGRCFLAILEFNNISVGIHVIDTVLQRNLDLALNRFTVYCDITIQGMLFSICDLLWYLLLCSIYFFSIV